ncbi:MAG: HEAT repeat domain-containing protein [Acidobacteria bacterium]|nr:HEAT repeat domain-containing protein [Acidobacteriota bacterium]
MERIIRDLLQSFSSQPNQVRAALKHLAINNSRDYYRGALDLLTGLQEDSPGARFLATQLVMDGVLWDVVADSDLLEVEPAVSLIRRLMRVEPLLDSQLIARTLEEASKEQKQGMERRIGRALEVLTGVVGGARVLPALTRLVKHTSPHIRSKAALLIGRANRNAGWVRMMLLESDARIRANAVEALWKCDVRGCEELFLKASADRTSRVAGNGAVGLYHLGDVRAIRLLRELAERPQDAFRTTAAWAMGETEDPRFLGVLAEMVTDEAPGVRRNALRARTRILKRQREAAGKGGIDCHLLGSECSENGERTLRLGVNGPSTEPPLATQFAFVEGGRPVWEYSLTRGPEKEGSAVGFVLPRGAEGVDTALLAALERKSRQDQWAVQRFDRDSTTEEAGRSAAEFSSERSSVAGLLKHTPQRLHCPASPVHAIRSLFGSLSEQPGSRNIVVLVEADEMGTPGREGTILGREARQAGIRIHGIRLDSSIAGWLDRAAEACGGIVEACAAENFAGVLGKLLCAAGQIYEFSYVLPGRGDGKAVRVEITSGCGIASDEAIVSTRTAGMDGEV